MQRYIITVKNSQQAECLQHFVEGLEGVTMSISRLKNPAYCRNLHEFRYRIRKARQAVANGEFLTDEQFENETAKW